MLTTRIVEASALLIWRRHSQTVDRIARAELLPTMYSTSCTHSMMHRIKANTSIWKARATAQLQCQQLLQRDNWTTSTGAGGPFYRFAWDRMTRRSITEETTFMAACKRLNHRCPCGSPSPLEADDHVEFWRAPRHPVTALCSMVAVVMATWRV